MSGQRIEGKQTSGDEVQAVKRALARLAGDDSRTIIERADASLDDLEEAATFVECVGLDALAANVSTTDDPRLQARGAAALAAFQRFRVAAAGEQPPDRDPDTGDDDHFHPGHGTALRRGHEGAER